MNQIIYQVDAFTDTPFTGNPAGVCLLSSAADESWMQVVAREMNLSETAFTYPVEDGYRLRWFTPTSEVDLCGHATLSAAHILWESGALPADRPARFQTASGELVCRLRDRWIEMDFPVTPPTQIVPPDGLLEILGIDAEYVGASVFDYLVEAESEEAVRTLSPDIAGIARLGVRGVIVTAPAEDTEVDFVSRFFAPSVGVDEDPVTGSTHCCLAHYWAHKLGKNKLSARQLSARGGSLSVELRDDRVKLLGQAVTVLRAELLVG